VPTDQQVEDLEAALVWGKWPVRGIDIDTAYRSQESTPLVPAEVVRAMAPDESKMFLAPPPFRLVSDDAQANPAFWHEFGALDEIAPEHSVIIADFEHGSDSMVIVELLPTGSVRVLRLQWDDAGAQHWVPVSASVTAFRAAIEAQKPAAPE